MSAVVDEEIWCKTDKHEQYECFEDFNEWLDSDDGIDVKEKFNLISLANPSKALFTGDYESYIQAFKEYRISKRNEVLSKEFFNDTFGDDHWFERNLSHFNQLVDLLAIEVVVPFIGAGLSREAGFPTWREHLIQQARTAGLSQVHVLDLLNKGEYEKVIDEIETKRGRDVFVQEIRDVFSKTGKLTNTTLRISELFNNTVITTNYDRLLEKVYDTGEKDSYQIISNINPLDVPLPNCVTIIKLHGNITVPASCILSKKQYDEAYGSPDLDITLPIPKLLAYYYKTSSLLFLGSSLYQDRTMQVFEAIKNSMGDIDRPQHFAIESCPDDEDELRNRNEYLSKYGITAIWFEKDRYDLIENILRFANNELKSRNIVSDD